MEVLPQELENMRKNQISEREDHWSSHVNTLMEDHNRVFNEANDLVKRMQKDLEVNTLLRVSAHIQHSCQTDTKEIAMFCLGLQLMIIF